MWSSFCLLCVLLFTHPFGCQGNSDAASGGASGSVNAESFKAMVVQCVLVLEGWWAGPGGQGTGQHGEEDKDKVVALLPAHWKMLVRIQLFTQSL